MSLPSHLHHTTTKDIYRLFCNSLNFSSRASYAIWTVVPGILSGTMYLNIWQIRPCVHPGGKPLCSPHQHSNTLYPIIISSSISDSLSYSFNKPKLIPHASYKQSRHLQEVNKDLWPQKIKLQSI